MEPSIPIIHMERKRLITFPINIYCTSTIETINMLYLCFTDAHEIRISFLLYFAFVVYYTVH